MYSGDIQYERFALAQDMTMLASPEGTASGHRRPFAALAPHSTFAEPHKTLKKDQCDTPSVTVVTTM
jgi:hypothetical protein